MQTTIDIAGSIKELLRWGLLQIIIILSVILVGLSAPILYTVGAEWLVWQDPNNVSSWVAFYFLTGPFACAFWMTILCHFHSIRHAAKAGKLGTWRDDNGGIWAANLKSTWFMFVGFFGSVLGEVVLLVASYKVWQVSPWEPNRANTMVYFAVAPFFVFAPALLLLIKRRNYSESGPVGPATPSELAIATALLAEYKEECEREEAERAHGLVN